MFQVKLSDIAAFENDDLGLKQDVAISATPYYLVLSIDPKFYYFHEETGKFDAISYQVAG